MRLDILANLLVTAGLGQLGSTIFIHRMDESVGNGLLLKAPIAGIPTIPELPGYYKAPFQIIVRNLVQADGDALAAQATQVLTITEQSFNNLDGTFAMQIKQMYPTRLPIVYPRSTGNYTEWSINMHADYVMAPGE
jgi:Bacteriophage minor capsid protein